MYHLRNNNVLERIGIENEILSAEKIRKLSYLEYIMKNEKYKILKLIILGKIQKRREHRRQFKSIFTI